MQQLQLLQQGCTWCLAVVGLPQRWGLEAELNGRCSCYSAAVCALFWRALAGAVHQCGVRLLISRKSQHSCLASGWEVACGIGTDWSCVAASGEGFLLQL